MHYQLCKVTVKGYPAEYEVVDILDDNTMVKNVTTAHSKKEAIEILTQMLADAKKYPVIGE